MADRGDVVTDDLVSDLWGRGREGEGQQHGGYKARGNTSQEGDAGGKIEWFVALCFFSSLQKAG